MHKHRLLIIKRLSGGDYPKNLEKCLKCKKEFKVTYKALTKPFIIDIEEV